MNITINNAKIVIKPQDGVTIEIKSDIQIDAGLFSAFTSTLSNSSVRFKNGTIKVMQNQTTPAIQNILMALIESHSSSSSLFSKLTLSEIELTVANAEATTDTFTILDLDLNKMPDVTSAKGVIKINDHNINIDYEYYDTQHINNTDKENNFLLSFKSPIFEIVWTRRHI
jgi:hypothetical protein